MTRVAARPEHSSEIDWRDPAGAPFSTAVRAVAVPASVARAAEQALEPIGRHAPLGLPCQVHDAELWFADDPADLERAKALCADCPVRSACLAGAIRRNETAGVWGGQIVQGGRVIPYKRPRGRPRKTGRTSAGMPSLAAARRRRQPDLPVHRISP